MSLYQSPIRKTIQKDIYNKPTFTINLFGKDYFGTIKTKKLGPITLKRYQILGIELPKDHKEISKAIQEIKSKFGHHWTDIFFQRGITSTIQTFNVKDINNELSNSLRDTRLSLRSRMREDYHLIHSFRENLPESGIVYDLSKTDEELIKDMNKASSLRTKKAIKNDIGFRAITEAEYDKFYHKRQQTAGKKGFHTITKHQYHKLVKHLISTHTGNVFITEHEGEILSGAICIFDQKNLVCLYSFADRNHNNIGGQQYLKFKIFTWGRAEGFATCDMMGGAPTGFPEHELASVSAFKESMGGIKTEYTGNFDIVLNPRLYKIFKRMFTLRK
ncbi:MAG: peptidoglycan bridge formation glycyltransferase FemA/FemB family protein [Candidatus Absconditabacteria bacterium]|nr:peptidoglycan bridge formation glycyltransferase FemA/FemB family protein [Candidatus Absconditabacteria bacterium]